MLVASFVVPSLDRSLETAVTLVRQASPLPIDAASARDMLLAQIGLSSDIAKHLDLRAPMAGAAVTGRPGTPPLMAFSLTARSAPDVAAVMVAAGTVIARRGAALQIQARTGEKGWFIPFDKVLLIADSEEALTMAGALALEGRQGGADDVSVVVYPEVLARAMGTTVSAELERMMSRGEAGPGGARRSATNGDARATPLRGVAGYLADATSVELALSLDTGRGMGLKMRLVPRVGTRLELLAREVRVAAPDARTGGGEDNPGAFIASGYDRRNLEPLRLIRGLLPVAPAGEPGKASSPAPKGGARAPQDARIAGALLDALLGGLTGDVSGAFRVRPFFSGEIVYTGKSREAAAVIGAALSRVDQGALGAVLEATTRATGEAVAFKLLSARAEPIGKLRGLHARMSVTLAADSKKTFSKLFGPKGLDLFVAELPGERFALAFGGDAKSRLMAMTTGAPVARAAPLSDAVTQAGARSLFAFIDLRDAIRFGLALGQDSRERAVGDSLSAPMPVFGGVTGEATGKHLTIDLAVPPACFAGMGGLLQAAMMMR